MSQHDFMKKSPDPYKGKRCTIYGQPGKVHGTHWSFNDGWKVTVIGLDNGARINYPPINDIIFEDKNA